MFTVKLLRQDANSGTVEETREGVVDLKTFPKVGKAKLVFNNDRNDETIPMSSDTTVFAVSPLK